MAARAPIQVGICSRCPLFRTATCSEASPRSKAHPLILVPESELKFLQNIMKELKLFRIKNNLEVSQVRFVLNYITSPFISENPPLASFLREELQFRNSYKFALKLEQALIVVDYEETRQLSLKITNGISFKDRRNILSTPLKIFFEQINLIFERIRRAICTPEGPIQYMAEIQDVAYTVSSCLWNRGFVRHTIGGMMQKITTQVREELMKKGSVLNASTTATTQQQFSDENLQNSATQLHHPSGAQPQYQPYHHNAPLQFTSASLPSTSSSIPQSHHTWEHDYAQHQYLVAQHQQQMTYEHQYYHTHAPTTSSSSFSVEYILPNSYIDQSEIGSTREHWMQLNENLLADFESWEEKNEKDPLL